MHPEPWQERILEEVSGLRDLGSPRGCLLSVHASRGAGKTHAVALILARAIETQDLPVLLVAPTPARCREILLLVNASLTSAAPFLMKKRPSETTLTFANGARIECVSERDRRFESTSVPAVVVWDDAPAGESPLVTSILPRVMQAGGLIIAFARAARLGIPPFDKPAPLLGLVHPPLATYRDLARDYQLYKVILRP